VARRGHGEGSIYKGPEGRWRAVVDLGQMGGKRQRKYLSGKTRREVQLKLTAALRDHQQGLPLALSARRWSTSSRAGSKTPLARASVRGSSSATVNYSHCTSFPSSASVRS
jgi:hypothetical protein